VLSESYLSFWGEGVLISRVISIYQRNAGPLVFQSLLHSQNRRGRNLDRAKREKGALKGLFPSKGIVKRNSSLLHNFIFILPRSKLHCVYYAHITEKKM
jgi:hypothetical protein